MTTGHKTGTYEEWRTARLELLAAEKQLTRLSDDLARQRRELPWVPPTNIEAVDGASPFYQCNEIRQNGHGGLPQDQCLAPCGLAVRMAAAEAAWRESLAGVTIADILAGLPDSVPGRTRALLARRR